MKPVLYIILRERERESGTSKFMTNYTSFLANNKPAILLRSTDVKLCAQLYTICTYTSIHVPTHVHVHSLSAILRYNKINITMVL